MQDLFNSLSVTSCHFRDESRMAAKTAFHTQMQENEINWNLPQRDLTC